MSTVPSQTPISKAELIAKLRVIKEMGWIENRRHGNTGGIGNTLEDLLGITENNLPIPNAAEWELKCQRLRTTSLTTLFHMEPSPTALRFVPSIFLPNYGWPHQKAGSKYPAGERSFRQTISTSTRSERGFCVVMDNANRRVTVSFSAESVATKHAAWLRHVTAHIGTGELDPQPYWGFDDLYHKAGTKLYNCFFIQAEVKRSSGRELYQYSTAFMLRRFSQDKFMGTLAAGHILIDFDARTGHNHGTKFRYRNNRLPELYEDVEQIM